MDSLLPVIGLIIGVLMVTTVATRLNLPAPIVLVIVGFAVSFVPGIPTFQASPDLVLFVLLPPLLFGAAFESSAVAIRQLLRPIIQMSVVLVLLTAFSVALVLKLVLPDLPFPAALALGAIVAPPDAVAAVAVGRKVGLPRRLVTVLEGESLFNDATALVTLKVAIAAIGASTLSVGPALGEFAWAALGGLAIGAALGFGLSYIRRIAGSPLTVTVLSLVSPFGAYAIGEKAHVSGVIVVVVVGLVLGHRSPLEVAASARLTESANWAALRFALEGLVFALIGLQLREIVGGLDTSQSNVYLAMAAVLATVLLSRPLWLSVIHLVTRLAPVTTHVGSRGVAALSWSGMRGVVSLAAAQTLPMETPYRSLLLVCTTVVIIGTLVLQGLSLPWVIRRLGVVEDSRGDDLRQRTEAHARAAAAVNERVDELVRDGEVSDRQAELMRRWASMRDWRSWEDDGASREFGRKLSVLSDWRLRLLAIERSVIVTMRNDSQLDEDVLIEMQRDLDLEEALLERRSEAVDGHLDEVPEAADSAGDGPDSVEQDVETKEREDPDPGSATPGRTPAPDEGRPAPAVVETADLTEDAARIDATDLPTAGGTRSSRGLIGPNPVEARLGPVTLRPCTFAPLGYRTDLALLRWGGSQIVDRGDHLVVRSPHNPTHWWGNFLLLDAVPPASDTDRWLESFGAEFPGAAHVALGFDGVDGTVADLAGFTERGCTAEAQTVMTASEVRPPVRSHPGAVNRPLVDDDDWAQSIALRLRCHAAEPAYDRAFVAAKVATQRALVEAGHGGWFGAFVDGRLVCQMGLFRIGDGIARFQSVETDPAFRRRGLAGALVHHVSRYGFDRLGARTLVMVADPDYVAIDLYRAVGFRDTEAQCQVERIR